jgi:hypothetical protein
MTQINIRRGSNLFLGHSFNGQWKKSQKVVFPFLAQSKLQSTDKMFGLKLCSNIFTVDINFKTQMNNKNEN